MIRILLLTGLLLSDLFPAMAAVEKPNMILLMGDDHGWEETGYNGHPDLKTPVLDEIASTGLRLNRFYAAHPSCSPTRGSVLTGRHPNRYGTFAPGYSLRPEEITIGQLLGEAGYLRGHFGKWHVGTVKAGSPTNPGAMGFDYWVSHDNFFELDPPLSRNGGPPVIIKGESSAVVIGETLRFIKKAKSLEKPFLTVVWFGSPHEPYSGLPEDLALYDDLPKKYADRAPVSLTSNKTGRRVKRPLGEVLRERYAEITAMDRAIGELRDFLKSEGLRDNTLVWYCGDNGTPPSGVLASPLRGRKGQVYEGGIRVPAVIEWPTRIRAPRVSETNAVTSDMLPTLCALAGAPVPDARPLDGLNLVPLFNGSLDERPAPIFFWNFISKGKLKTDLKPWIEPKWQEGTTPLVKLMGDIATRNFRNYHHPKIAESDYSGARVMLGNRHKLVIHDADGEEGANPKVELFDLRADSTEATNLAESEPAIVKTMRIELRNWQQSVLKSLTGADYGNQPTFGMGAMVGEVTPAGAHIQARLTKGDQLVGRDLPGAAGFVQFVLTESGKTTPIESQSIEATAENDFIARATFEKLTPGTEFSCQITFGIDPVDTNDGGTRNYKTVGMGPTVTFGTLPGTAASTPAKFVVVTGMNYAKFHGDDRIDRSRHLLLNNTDLSKPYVGPDKALGYPALESILKLKPDFLVGTGDNVYYDTPDDPRAETITELRQKWHEQFVQPRYRDLFAAVPTYWMIDDHDYRIDDADNSGDYNPTPQVGREIMLEQLPVAAAGDDDAKTYRTHRVSRDLQIWMTENRMYRSDNATEDGPNKTIWGAEQKAWLKKTLLASDAAFKILISPMPMIGPDDLRKTDNHSNIGGFRHERDAFFAWLKENGLENKNFYIICGDRHWQYQSVDPTGIEEFSCGALVDANSRLGRKPGDPKSTDPEALIKQPYYQDPRSGGFLMVSVTPATGEEGIPAKLTFTWHDEKGAALHTTSKTGPFPSR
jgi:arylsulfatase A-like enzyme/phosphodiesterase/alkaline phosphatase D-like protein